MKNGLRWLCLVVALLPPLTLYADVLSKDLVRETQILLWANGVEAGPIDGILGDQTKSAIRSYIEKHTSNLSLTGQVGPELTGSLREKAQAKARNPNYSGTSGNNKGMQETIDQLNRKFESVKRGFDHPNHICGASTPQ